MKRQTILVAIGMVVALGLAFTLAVEAEVTKPANCVDEQLAAEKLRYGTEAYNRGMYSEAKAYFRQAVKADPESARAWAFYDLSMMYDLAKQVERKGQVVASSAPAPGTGPAASAGESKPAEAPAAAPMAEKPAEKPAESKPALAPAVPVIPKDEGC